MKIGFYSYCFVFFILLLVTVSPVVNAQQQTTELGEIVVTARQQAITQVAAIDEIDAATIDEHGYASLADAMQSLPGVSMTVGKRNEQTFTIRGYDQRQVPVLLDGIPLVVPYDGYIDNGSLPLDNLAKITLTRGPGSVLYGSNAMGGVVNIITRRPEQPVELRCNAGAGERGAAWGHLALGYRAEHYYLMTDFSARDEDDFRLSDDYEDTNNENGEIRFNSDRQSNHVAIKLGLLPAIGHEYALGVNYVDSEWGMPVAADGRQRYWRFSDWRRTSWYLSGRSVIGDAGELQSRIYYDTFDNVLDSYDDQSLTTQSRRYAFHSTYDDYSYGGSSIYHPGVSAVHDLGLSFHYRRDTHREQGDHGAAWETSRSELYSCGFEDNYDLNQQLSLVVGVSYDLQRPVAAASGFQRDDEDAWNPMAGLSWQINESLRSWFTVARKTRFPTLKELYSGINNDRVLPNGDLSEEHSTHYEIGCEHQLGSNMRTRLCLFYSDISDLIEEKSVDSNVSQKQNIGDARYVGGEISFYYKLPRQHDFINIHYTFLNAQNVSSSRTSDHLSGRPQHKLHIDHRWQISDSLQLVTSLQWNGSRYCEQDTEDWHKLSPYWMLNSQLNVAVNKHWGVQCGVTNLLDEDYALDVDYPQPGRRLYCSVSYKY